MSHGKKRIKIFYADTHAGPQADILARCMNAADRERLKGFEEFRSQSRRMGHCTYNCSTRK